MYVCMYACMYVCTYVCMYTYLYMFVGTAPITNGMATVTVNGLECGVTYTITVGGTLNGDLVGPRSFHENVTAGLCPKNEDGNEDGNGNGMEDMLHLYVRTYVCYLN